MKLRLHLAVLAGVLGAAFHRITHPNALVLGNSVLTLGAARDTAKADAAIGRRKVITIGSDADHIALCGVSDIPLGATEDASASAAEERLAFAKFGLITEELEGTASGGITLGDFLVPAASGALRTLPTDPGTYYICGRATVTALTGAAVSYIPCFPIQRVVS